MSRTAEDAVTFTADEMGKAVRAARVLRKMAGADPEVWDPDTVAFYTRIAGKPPLPE